MSKGGSDIADGTEDNGEYELRQRQAVVEQWASASQEFRADLGSHSKPEPKPKLPWKAMERIEKTIQEYNPYGLISLAPIDSAHPANRVRFVEFAVLMYRFDPEAGHCLEDSNMPELAPLNPASHITNRFKDCLPWSDLETADFRSIFLTRSGVVAYNEPAVFHLSSSTKLEQLKIICQCALSICDIRHCEGGHILSHALAANQLSSDIDLCNRDQWAEHIKLYAPGYLALEEAGCGVEYELTRLIVPDEIAGIKKRVWDKLKTGQVLGFTYLPDTQSQPRPPLMNIQAMLAALSRQHAESR
ncbi:hypothetical protein BDW59DRAFT_171364 [Aspergillus cavernicola]|uniref:Uncharacterized protein n=1 Tax=Aspergillus cavernicola TaxID=176166 RepID=A0ABR4IHU0_9EURO